MRFGLDRMHKLMTVLGMPQRRFASIHVVGTNGKSSTTRMVAAILERHGLRTGAYTSPHLRSFSERIEVAGQPVSDAEFAAAVSRAAHAAELVDRTLVVGALPPEADALAREVAAERHASLVRAPESAEVPMRALGSFQRRNFALARAAAEAFLGALEPDAVARAAAEVEIPGRLQVV